jgi:hypothetical protein
MQTHDYRERGPWKEWVPRAEWLASLNVLPRKTNAEMKACGWMKKSARPKGGLHEHFTKP